MKWHFAELWETISDAIPERTAIVNGNVRRSWREYEDRAARLAAAFSKAGLQPDSKVALYAYNSNEYLEAQFGAFKMRGVPVNVNYRYLENELLYLLENSDSEAIVFDAQFGERIATIRAQLPKLKLLVEIDDGSGAHLDGALRYEDVIAQNAPFPRAEYSEDDIYMLYTGGTTGMPKGVMYRQGDFALGLMLGYDVRGLARPQTKEELTAAVRNLAASGASPVSLAASPLMHGTGLWLGVIVAHNLGGTAVTFRNVHFDPHELWALVQKEKVSDVTIVGDAFAKPMLKALHEAREAGKPYDVSSLKMLISSGVMFSAEVKRGLLEFADMAIVDAMGSTEGSMGMSIMTRDTPAETAKFMPNPTTKVFTEDGREVQPGSGEIGMIANGGFTPIGYYKDPVKSAATFRVINGHRYSIPGDFAQIAADGTLILLGRGSMCINTGGEKVFPEEVEEAVKSHPAVYDCLVVGVPDERFGERVTAVVSFRDREAVGEQEMIDFVRTKLAGYKLPKTIIRVGEVMRAANGKADYAWAKAVAKECAAL